MGTTSCQFGHEMTTAGAIRLLSSAPGNMSLAEEASLVRKEIAAALFRAGGGHYGGSLSVADLLLVLYRRCIRLCPEQLDHPERDRFVLSKGHAVIALYAVMDCVGILAAPLSEYGMPGTCLTSHPDMRVCPGIDFTTGSLGQGLSVGIGMALASPGSRVWVVLGDGECQEGQVWEAALLAERLKVSNLIVIVDCNDFQECSGLYDGCKSPPPPPVEGLDAKFNAFGWRVEHCDGHDFDALEICLTDAASQSAKPTVVLAKTIKGKGVDLIEKEPYRFHCGSVNFEEHAEIMEALS